MAFLRTPNREDYFDNEGQNKLNTDLSLFSRLYILCQSRGGTAVDCFSHENYLNSPALSQNGKMRLGTKLDLETVTIAIVVWDAYIANVLKVSTKSKTERGIRRRVQSKKTNPKN